MRISEAGFEQLESTVSFHVTDTIFPWKNVFLFHREMLFKTLFMAKNWDKYALFLSKLFVHTSSY